MHLIALFVSLFIATSPVRADFGHPGHTPNWSSAKKVQIGTSSLRDRSFVWFTNASGVLTEVYYPTIDKAQLKDSQLLVTDHESFMVEERTQTHHDVQVLSPSAAKLVNTDLDPRKKFQISHEFFTLNNNSVIVDEIVVDAYVDGLSFYLLTNPAMNNTGFYDNGHVRGEHLYFHEGTSQLTVYSSVGMDDLSVGYVGASDGHTDLKDNLKLDWHFETARSGNVAGVGRIKIPAKRGRYKFYIVYSFSSKRDLNLNHDNLHAEKLAYHRGWNELLSTFKAPSGLSATQAQLYWRSLYVLRVMEDKFNPGALIASLSKPWGETLYEDPNKFTGGYHLVWPRDLYHVCLALFQAGDYQTVLRAISFLKRIQYQEGAWTNYPNRRISKKGAFPQNVWTTGEEYWSGLQIDQTAYPVHIFALLYKHTNREGRQLLLNEYGNMVIQALDFIKYNGPWSGQERWEENYGISPSSFAAAASALLLGDMIFPHRDYAKTARGWLDTPGDNIHNWTFTQNGFYGDGQYYVRVSGCSSTTGVWNPNRADKCLVANTCVGDNCRHEDQRKIVDQGFLKLALLGLVDAGDWRVEKSLAVVNQINKVNTPHGPGWYRYTFDAYGENRKGRLWPLLSSEHARYSIEKYRDGKMNYQNMLSKVSPIINSYLGFANKGQMLPEQVWETTGEGTGAATPLAWSHAEYVKLLWSVNLKKNVENLLER